ncbi:hypothetical protein MTO96_035629 [Rhipicephalus appendiculatus]
MCHYFREDNGRSIGLVVGEEELVSFWKWFPTHTQFPLRRQHQRLILILEESGLRLHAIKNRYGSCNNGTALAVFDISFSDYVAVYLIGCSLSLLAFAAEVVYQRCFLARRASRGGPAVVNRHR